MGAILFRRIELVTSLSEVVGYKAGVALSREQMHGFLEEKESGFLTGNDETTLRVRSEVYAEMVCQLLYSVGNIRSPNSIPSFFDLYDRFKKDKKLFPIYLKVDKAFAKFVEQAPDSPIDHTPFVRWAKKEFGTQGMSVALTILESLREDAHKNSLIPFRKFEWKDAAALNELFESENLKTSHGVFFDQRFVDYLSHNYESIARINWRKFEGLTCEFFDRIGLHVEIGKGRNDDGIDARIWDTKDKKHGSPLILVQCKREKRTIGKVIVKALYADVAHEKAQLGLVVTTSRLSAGAKKVCSARSYPVHGADREALKQWILAMRTPYAGVFLGE